VETRLNKTNKRRPTVYTTGNSTQSD